MYKRQVWARALQVGDGRMREFVYPALTAIAIIVFVRGIGHYTGGDLDAMLIGALLFWQAQHWWRK